MTCDQRVLTAFCRIFSGTPQLTIFGALKFANKYAPIYAKYGQLSDLVNESLSFHFSFPMKQRLQSLKLPAMATRGLKQRNIVISFFERQWAGAP